MTRELKWVDGAVFVKIDFTRERVDRFRPRVGIAIWYNARL